MDAAIPVDAKNAPTGIWKTAENAVSHERPHPSSLVYENERRKIEPALINLSTDSDQVHLIEHPQYGRAVVRDQKPLSERKLAGCLRDGLTTSQWLQILNSKVFFWVDPRRLTAFREARAYRKRRQLVLTVSTRELVQVYEDQILLTDRNSGATSPMAHPRGRDTFVTVKANTRRRVVELVIPGGVSDITRFVIEAAEEGGGRAPEILYKRLD